MKSYSQPLVAFNAHLLTREASYRSAGIAVYILQLLRHLASSQSGRAPDGVPQTGGPSALRYHVFLGAQGALPEEVTLPISQARWNTRHPARRILWEQGYLPLLLRRSQADLLHAPAFVGPLGATCPQVITVHDLSFMRHPEFFPRSQRLYLRAFTGIACRRAAAVIAVSDFTAAEVTALLGVPRERVHRVYHGVDPRFRPLPAAEVARFRRRRQLPERFILHVGTLEPRKNLSRLLDAFARLSAPDVHLVLAGGQGWFYEDLLAQVARLGLQQRVHFPGYVPDAELPLWYNAAAAFSYVSVYEGFGLPVLEALACGVPTLTADTTALPEAGTSPVGDPAALMVPPEDVAAIAEGLQRLLVDAELRQHLRRAGPAHAARFSWQRAAQETAAVYRHVLTGAAGVVRHREAAVLQ